MCFILVAVTDKALSTVLVGRANGPILSVRLDIDGTGFY
jgi:hypothetical protein